MDAEISELTFRIDIFGFDTGGPFIPLDGVVLSLCVGLKAKQLLG